MRADRSAYVTFSPGRVRSGAAAPNTAAAPPPRPSGPWQRAQATANTSAPVCGVEGEVAPRSLHAHGSVAMRKGMNRRVRGVAIGCQYFTKHNLGARDRWPSLKHTARGTLPSGA